MHTVGHEGYRIFLRSCTGTVGSYGKVREILQIDLSSCIFPLYGGNNDYVLPLGVSFKWAPGVCVNQEYCVYSNQLASAIEEF